jgi:hypothetical protein
MVFNNYQKKKKKVARKERQKKEPAKNSIEEYEKEVLSYWEQIKIIKEEERKKSTSTKVLALSDVSKRSQKFVGERKRMERAREKPKLLASGG